MNNHRWDDDLFDDSDDDDDLGKDPDVAEINAEISYKRGQIDDLEKEIERLETKLEFAEDKAKAVKDSGIPPAAMERVKEVGLRDFWTAPKGKQA